MALDFHSWVDVVAHSEARGDQRRSAPSLWGDGGDGIPASTAFDMSIQPIFENWNLTFQCLCLRMRGFIIMFERSPRQNPAMAWYQAHPRVFSDLSPSCLCRSGSFGDVLPSFAAHHVS
jgi:hypothetical protein